MDPYNSENDYILLYMIYQMDEDSLERLLNKYYTYSVKMLNRYLHRYELRLFGNDCLNDTQALIIKAVYAYRNDRNAAFITFYTKLLQHLIMNYRRHYWSISGTYERTTLSLDAHICDNYGQTTFTDVLVNDDITLEGIYTLYQEEYRFMIKKLLQELRPLEQQVVLLHEGGYSYRDIADLLHINMRQVEYILKKARKSKALID